MILPEQLNLLTTASPRFHVLVYDSFEDDKCISPTHTEIYCEYSIWSTDPHKELSTEEFDTESSDKSERGTRE